MKLYLVLKETDIFKFSRYNSIFKRIQYLNELLMRWKQRFLYNIFPLYGKKLLVELYINQVSHEVGN